MATKPIIEIAPEPSDHLLELHDRLEQYNFDLVYLPEIKLFDVREVSLHSSIK